MNKLALIAGIATVASGAAAGVSVSGPMEVLLEIDISVADQVTISATDGLAAQSASGSNFTGYLLADFFTTPGTPGGFGSGTGTLTTVGNASDGTPSLFQGGTSVGLNIWSFSSDSTVSVIGDEQAFEGSATWSLSAAQYTEFESAATFGEIYLGADTDDDLAGSSATLIGLYRVVPTPGAFALLGMGGFVVTRRRH